MSQISVLVTIKSNRAQYQEDSIKYQVTLNSSNFYTASFRATIIDELINNSTLVKRDSDSVSIIVPNTSISDSKLVDEVEGILQLPTGDPENLMFNVNSTYGTPLAPRTGSILLNSDDFKLGISVLLLHNDSVEPTFGLEFKKLSGSYVTNELNYIAFESLAEDHIIYSISQVQV